jgi:hypothetical protein
MEGEVHGLGDRLVDQVDDELAGDMDVARGVLGRSVGVVLQAQHDQRRVLGEHVEERERRGVDDAVRAQRGDERDRARHDEAAQQLVALARLEIGELQREIGHQGCSSSGSSTTPTCDVINP